LRSFDCHELLYLYTQFAAHVNSKIRLNMVRDALSLLADASRKIQEIEAATPPDEVWSQTITVRSSLHTATGVLERYRQVLQRQEDERRKRFDSVPVLQAMLRFKDGSTRRVAVSKPTDAIDEPHIGEMFYAALERQGVVASLEPFPVLVVDKRNRVTGKIPVATADIML